MTVPRRPALRGSIASRRP